MRVFARWFTKWCCKASELRLDWQAEARPTWNLTGGVFRDHAPRGSKAKGARDGRQAAQGSVVHNDDTGMRILKLVRNTGDGRTGTFTSGIVSIWREWRIALYFTGWKHAGENLAHVLKQRAAELNAPIQMCDALSRNAPKAAGVFATLMANCLAHGRRNFVEVTPSFLGVNRPAQVARRCRRRTQPARLPFGAGG